MEFISSLHIQSVRLWTAYQIAVSNKAQSIMHHRPDIFSACVCNLEKQQSLGLSLAIFIHSTRTKVVGRKEHI